MKLVVWKIRGLNDLLKQREVKRVVPSLHGFIICLIETRFKVEKAENIEENIAPGWGFIQNYAIHYLGRIWISWDPKQWTVTSMQQHEQAVSCEIHY